MGVSDMVAMSTPRRLGAEVAPAAGVFYTASMYLHEYP
jgi:hypothetical protein